LGRKHAARRTLAGLIRRRQGVGGRESLGVPMLYRLARAIPVSPKWKFGLAWGGSELRARLRV